MKQTTLFDYFPKNVEYRLEIKNSEKISKEQKIGSETILKQYKPLVKSLIQKNLAEIIQDEEEFRNLLNLLGENWFYDEESFGYTDKNRIMAVSIIQQFNILFFKLYKENGFVLIKNFELDVENLTNKEFMIINNIEYNSVYLSKAFDILNNSFKIYQHKSLKLLYLKGKKLCVLICPKL